MKMCLVDTTHMKEMNSLVKVDNKFDTGERIKKSHIKGTQVWVTAVSQTTTIMTIPMELIEDNSDKCWYAIVAFGVGCQPDGILMTKKTTLEGLVKHLNMYGYVEAEGTIYIKNMTKGDD